MYLFSHSLNIGQFDQFSETVEVSDFVLVILVVLFISKYKDTHFFILSIEIDKNYIYICTLKRLSSFVNMQDNQQEIFPIVDKTGKVIGSATRGECHSGSHLLHPVVHLHVFNSHGEVYLQKRPEWKDIQPGKWDTAVGGHIDYGETPEEALVREVREELGMTDFTPERVGLYVFDSQRESELVYVHRTVYDGPVRPSADELDGGRFWSLDEIRSAIGNGILTPNFESEFQRFFLTK